MIDRRMFNRIGHFIQNEKNPFDRNPQSIPLIRFMLHTDSLSTEILTKDSPVYRLTKLSSFKEIEVIPLPTVNENIRTFFNTNGLISTEYYWHSDGMGLKASDGSIYNVASPPPKNLLNPIIYDSKVTLADLFASNICDYLVVGATEPSLMDKVARNNIITAAQALEMVRIILTANSRFYISAEVPVRESFYYLYRFKKLFRKFQYAWTIAAYAHGKGLPEKIHDQLLSLGTRLEFICRSYDKVAFFSLKTPDYNDQNNQLYHLVYFIMLITGVFDDLAHIIDEFYNMETKSRKNISLRIPLGEKPNKFYQTLQFKNASLYQFLTTLAIQKGINVFYPLRDSLQHRELPLGVQLTQGSEMAKNVFELNNETFEELKKISDSPIFIIRGKPCFLDPLPFIKWAQEVTITLVNRCLSSIDWNSFCLTLPADIQNKIHESNELFQNGVGQFLGWPEEPLYF